MIHYRVPKIWIVFFVIIFLMVFGGPLMAAVPTAATLAANGIGSTGATLNGTVNANGEKTTVFFEYGLLGAGYSQTVTADQNPINGSTETWVSANVGELQPNTTYHFRVVAQNASGTTYGGDLTFDTLHIPPVVLTTEVTGIGADSATLNGIVHPQGADTTVIFEYGTDLSYGNSASAVQSPLTIGLDSAQAVSTDISGLSNNTTYHFRAVAQNAGGTTYGNDMIFTIGTVGTAPTAATNAATGIGTGTATLHGMVNAGNSATMVMFEYGLDTGYGSMAIASQSPISGNTDTAVSAVLSELLPNMTYHYRVTAINSNGSDNGADMTFATLPKAPAAVTDTASSVGTTNATLNGTVNANGGSATVTFEYGLTEAYGTAITATQSPVTGTTDTAVSRVISGLTNGLTYHYRVVAVNSGGNTYGADMTFTTGVTPPTVFTNAASGVSTTTATLNGTVNANGSSTTITFEYGLTTAYERTAIAVPDAVNGFSNTAVSASLSTLIPNTTYHYRLVGVNAGGATYGADMTFTTLAAPAVTSTAASSVTNIGATLNGTVNANGSSATVTFEYGTTSAYGTTVTADQSPVTGSTDTAVSNSISALTPDTVYHYRVVGQNLNGTTYGADMTFVTTVGTSPIVATNPAKTVLSDGATLNGTVTANNSSTTVTFEFGLTTSYGTTVTADQSPVTGVGVSVSSIISGLSSNTTYHYRVVGQNAHGTTYGADITFTTSFNPIAVTEPATGVGASFATLNGIANGNGFNTSVTFEYGLTTAYGTTVTGSPSVVTGSTSTLVGAAITGLLNNTTYHYRIIARGITIVNGADMTFTTTTPPTAVTNAATAVGSSSATLNGTVNANNASTTVTFEYGLNTGYGLVVIAEQSPVTGSSDIPISNTLNTLAPSTSYHYRVVAQNVNDTIYGADMTFTTNGSPPSADTNAATDVSSIGATLNGIVNAKNDSTTVTFQYGLTTAYGTSVTADQSPVTGAGNTLVNIAITALTHNTTYHFRVVAQNSSGTTYGADMTFFTGTAAPMVNTGTASNIGPSSATLNATVNANNGSTTVNFEYGETMNYGRTVTADQSPVTGSTDTAVSFTPTDLNPNNTYHFRAVGQNAAGTTYGTDMTFTTNLTGTATVTTADVTNIAATSLTCGGNVIHEGNAPVTARGACWRTTPNPTTADSTTSDGTGVGIFSSNLTGLMPLTTYYVRAYAANIYGTTYGEERTFTTLPLAPIVSTDAATALGITFATLNGTVNANNENTTVNFEYGLEPTYGTTIPAEQSPLTGYGATHVSADVVELTPNTTYHFRVVAQNNTGTAYGDDMVFRTPLETPIPTISETGIIILGILLMFMGLAILRKSERVKNFGHNLK